MIRWIWAVASRAVSRGTGMRAGDVLCNTRSGIQDQNQSVPLRFMGYNSCNVRKAQRPIDGDNNSSLED